MILTNSKNPASSISIDYIKAVIPKFLLLIFLIIWIYGFLSPLLLSGSDPLLNYSLDRIYSQVCHQESYKCISIAETEMLVCARCAGIYFGAFIISCLFLFRKNPEINIKIFLLASIPLLADVIFTTAELYNYYQPFAFLTGLIFGSIICLFLLAEIKNLSLNKSINRNE